MEKVATTDSEMARRNREAEEWASTVHQGWRDGGVRREAGDYKSLKFDLERRSV